MTNFTVSSRTRVAMLLWLVGSACSDSGVPEAAAASPVNTAGTSANAAPSQPSAVGSGGAGASAPLQSATPQRPTAGTPAPAGMGGVVAPATAAGTSAAAASGSAGAAGSGADAGAGGASAAAPAGQAAAGQGAAGSAGSSGAAAATSFAAGLSELFLDAPCDSAARAPLEQGATCNHAPNTQRVEKMLSFGGEAGKSYKLTLRVRGIWEPTNVSGGMRPYEDVPFTIGGQVASGAGSSSDSINYQQYFIEVAEPKQTYWLNDYQYVAHDIHKEDYEATLTVAGGSQIKVVMNDGNEREIANFPKEMFADVPPYDKMPSLGQSLRLDVVGVEPAP